MSAKQAFEEVGFRCKHEVHDRLLTGTQVDFPKPAVRDWLHTAALPTAMFKTDCCPRATASEFWQWADDEIGPELAMTGIEKIIQFQVSRRSTACATKRVHNSLH